MDSTKVGRKKRTPHEVQFFPNGHDFEQQSIRKLKKQGKRPDQKRVHFNCHTPDVKQQASQNTECNSSEAARSDRSLFESHDPVSSSANMFFTKVPIVDHEPICSVRATVVTFVIVILIVLASAFAVGVVFGTINSGKNSSGTQTENNNQNFLSTVSTLVATSSVSIGSQSGPPCTSYTTINDPTRNVHQTGMYSTCDRGPLFNSSSAGSWIRFVGTGGTTMPDTPPNLYHCGGFFGG